MKRAIFLDRDGVINAMWVDPEHGIVDSPANPDQFCLLPEVPEAICRFRKLGFEIIVVSNQPGIAKNKMTHQLLQAITHKMEDDLRSKGAELDGIYYCLHHPEAKIPEYRLRCECRKPKPGLLIQAAREKGLDPAMSYMVGDGLTDVQAGAALGCTTIWLGNMKCDSRRIMEEIDAKPDLVAVSLIGAARLIEDRESAHGNIR